jgi:uncharacterized protein YjbJ (UPF0337 family)
MICTGSTRTPWAQMAWLRGRSSSSRNSPEYARFAEREQRRQPGPMVWKELLFAAKRFVLGTEVEDRMDWNRVEGNWKEMKGKVKEQWGKLTDDDLDVIDGKQDQLEGRLQQRYGYAKDQAKQEIDAWYGKQRW